MKTYELDVVDGVFLSRIDNKTVLLDTGSPFTVGKGSLPSFGSVWNSVPGLSVDGLGDLLGTPFDVLMGCDLLKKERFLLNQAERTVIFSPDDEQETGLQLELETSLNIPIVAARVNGRECRLVADIGSKATYVHPELVEGLTEDGTYIDFHFSVGRFSGPTYPTQLELAGETLEITVGALPNSTLANQLRLIGADGVLGNDLFLHFSKELWDLQNARLVLIP